MEITLYGYYDSSPSLLQQQCPEEVSVDRVQFIRPAKGAGNGSPNSAALNTLGRASRPSEHGREIAF
ncbi:hypothetical protein CapIbe_013861 [Capra ibex]